MACRPESRGEGCMEEKEVFVEPVVEVVVFDDDVICTSGCTGLEQTTETPVNPTG